MIGLLPMMKIAARFAELAPTTQRPQLWELHYRSREMFLGLHSVAFEKCRIEARKQGHVVSEQQLQDGSIRLQIQEGS
jgi:hypothetical protein